MEEDIKILDEVVGRSKELREKDFGMLIGTKQMHSIENLIKGYRELEAKYKLKAAAEAIAYNKIFSNPVNLNEYIPKSRIKEHIENREMSIDDIRDNLDIDQAMISEIKRLEIEIDVLETLMDTKKEDN